MFGTIFISSIQITADIICLFFSAYCFIFKRSFYKLFFILNSISFLSATFCDAYYNYFFRIQDAPIEKSVSLIVTLPVFIFQLCQAINWCSFIKKNNMFFSPYNFAYYAFSLMVLLILIYYFSIGNNLSIITTIYQSISVALDMGVWIFSIIVFSRALSKSIIFLTLGTLMIVSADLTTRCLFMFEMNELHSADWIHAVWAAGVVFMAAGFAICIKNSIFEFCQYNSMQVILSSWISSTSLVVFIIGFLFLNFLRLPSHVSNIHLMLWNFPIALMFIMIFSVFLGNRFSQSLLLPVNNFIGRIRQYNFTKNFEERDLILEKIYEFDMLSEFIERSINTISHELARKILFAKQVAHDVRSPLTALEMVIKRLPKMEDSKWIILRDALNHIRDITNNLDKTGSIEEGIDTCVPTQIAVLLEGVISERRITLSNSKLKINADFSVDQYALFLNVVPVEVKRIITNIINNACEAVIADEVIVQVTLSYDEHNSIIQVSDNGCGIPDALFPSVFKPGFSTKEKGSGLGLAHAKESIESWGGSIALQSNVDQGVSVFIMLPLQSSPKWFTEELVLHEHCDVICIDDSAEIYHAWCEKINSMNKTIRVLYCDSGEKLLMHLASKNENREIYFIDYEFSGKKYDGIDLANIILQEKKRNRDIYFVTSRSNELIIQKFCEHNDVQVIPKFYAFKMPMKILTARDYENPLYQLKYALTLDSKSLKRSM
ncbi:MAG: hypothetical protein COY58_09055 [Gammaproteobacteria bacterium CG_4_10_14_0_8_um_filter_38_16]|nr:MAG: hypothetical protein COY58_09055 [Gammaproteobacteria bacterium CG_4_10_14_0_8_um_filter_38_16]PJA03389.1 MAG: hypothetical protein COX72_05490 [Gammaproteobacteria bacterium CG_4_10_14_0_2_um_filter_38_22]PJB11123.1 MAG: hypothetical protein CO120_01240 [Gammaproteobacteria bacterium CG_4_9_14_3_um_filter_38_9]